MFVHTLSHSLKDMDTHQAVQVTGVQVRVGVAEEIPDELPEEIPDEFETPQVTCKDCMMYELHRVAVCLNFKTILVTCLKWAFSPGSRERI